MTTGQDPILSTVSQALGDVAHAEQCVCVGLSGGMDSVVLLHALFQLRAVMGFRLSAIHVHHGLSPNADDWAVFCETLCHERGVICEIVRIRLPDTSGKGVERVAREARYAAFAAAAGNMLCLAHHQNDRAETFLLNLFRGAGAIGLSAVPATRLLGQKRLLRPFIDTPRATLLAWAEAHQLRWIEDESNTDLRFRRNFLRHRVLPVITEAFPGVVRVLSRTADLMAEQTMLLDRLAELEAQACRDATGYLRVSRLQMLPEAAVRNILRWTLFKVGIHIPSSGRLAALSGQLMSVRPDAEVLVSMGAVGIHLWRDHVWIDAAFATSLPPRSAIADGTVNWPDGRLSITLSSSQSLDLGVAALGQGQRFQPQGRCRDTLSELLREQGVPPWVRSRLPGLWWGATLVWVPNLGWCHDETHRRWHDACEVNWQGGETIRL